MKTIPSAMAIRQYFTNSYRKNIRWMSEHPIKSYLFTCLFAVLGALLGINLALDCECTPLPLLATTIVAIGWQWLVVRQDTRKATITVLLVFSLLFQGATLNAQEKEPEKALPAVVVVVVVVTVVVGVKVLTCALKKLDRPPRRNLETNADPFLITGIRPAGLSDDYAATWTVYPLESCSGPLEGAAVSLPPVALELTGSFTRTATGLEFRLSQKRLSPEADLVDMFTYSQLLREHGVELDNSGVNVQHFGHNGQPASQQEVPIYFWMEDGKPQVAVASGEDPVVVAIERSEDLRTWESLLTMTMSTSKQLQFMDSTASRAMFYRFRPL